MLSPNRVKGLVPIATLTTIVVVGGTLLNAFGLLDFEASLRGGFHGYGPIAKDSPARASSTLDSTLPTQTIPHCIPTTISKPDHVEKLVEDWDPSRFLKGRPTKLFRDNLLENQGYITAWSSAGFTNQFMSYVNMIYLGLLSDRIPVIPPFAPDHHISHSAGALPFGRIFNLTRARREIHKPLLEWSDVKDLPSLTSTQPPPDSEREHLGCFSSRKNNEPNPYRVPLLMDNLRLDVSFSRAPTEARINPSNGDDDFLLFSGIAAYIYARRPLPPPHGQYELMQASPLGHELPPDEHMTCFDHLYFVSSNPAAYYEWRFSWSPAWVQVAKHLHFTDDLVAIAQGYLRRAFESQHDIPPFIAVHIRRGDFATQCYDTPGDCLIPLATFKKSVDNMITEIREKKNIEIKGVILMSDEKDPKFWEEVREIGWVHFDHEEEGTLEKYGEWYLPLVDIVAQSMARGFIGTEDSTFSLVSARRVEDWNDGPTVILTRADRDRED